MERPRVESVDEAVMARKKYEFYTRSSTYDMTVMVAKISDTPPSLTSHTKYLGFSALAEGWFSLPYELLISFF